MAIRKKPIKRLSTAVNAAPAVVLPAGTYIFVENPTINSEEYATAYGIMNVLTANNTYGGTKKFTEISTDVSVAGEEVLYIAAAYDWVCYQVETHTWSFFEDEEIEYTVTDSTKLRTIIFETDQTVPSDFYTWFTANTTKQSSYKFKHYYDSRVTGSGSYKFRHYSQKELILKTPTLSISGNTVTIVSRETNEEAVADIKLSCVKSTGGTTTSAILPWNTTSYTLPGDLIDDEATGTFYLTAIVEANAPYLDSDVSNRISYTMKSRLATPTNVTSSMTTISWDGVANAGSYKVYMDNVLFQDNAGTTGEVPYVFNDRLNNVTYQDSTPFTCGDKSYTKLIYTYASSTSNALLYYDSNNVATTVYSNGSWVSSTYKVLTLSSKPAGRSWYYDNGTVGTSTYSYDVSTNTLWAAALDGNHSFTIVASGNDNYRDSLQSSAVIIAKTSTPQLATPQNVTIDGTTLSWDEVENATSYDIYADGTLIGNTTGGGSNSN